MSKFRKPNRKIEKIFIHCSDSDVKSHDDIETIRKWHVEENGWSDIGYHYFVTKDGMVHHARPISKNPAAQKGHNARSIAICLSGKEKFTDHQFKSLKRFCTEIANHYDGALPIFGHRDVEPNKSCPNFEVKEVLGLNDNNLIKKGSKMSLIAGLVVKKLGIKVFNKLKGEAKQKALEKFNGILQDKFGINNEDDIDRIDESLKAEVLIEAERTSLGIEQELTKQTTSVQDSIKAEYYSDPAARWRPDFARQFTRWVLPPIIASNILYLFVGLILVGYEKMSVVDIKDLAIDIIKLESTIVMGGFAVLGAVGVGRSIEKVFRHKHNKK